MAASRAGDVAIKATLNLPKTHLPMRGGGYAREARHVERLTTELYTRQLAERGAGAAATFVLHDGPPYANGSLHIGHFLNKVLKDVLNRSRLLRGDRVLFVPGWDCHGLPIELKAVQEAHATRTAAEAAARRLPALEVRRLARLVADRAVAEQAADFKRWAVLADWDLTRRHTHGNVYVTMDAAYESAQLRVFASLVARGCVTRALRPVAWSPASGTALAEAELEYVETHISTAVHAAFPLHSVEGMPDGHARTALEGLHAHGGVGAVVWTTTPWSLPGNVALAVHPSHVYVAVRLPGERVPGRPAYGIVAEARADALLAEMDAASGGGGGAGVPPALALRCTGEELLGCLFSHPLGDELPSVPELANAGVRLSLLLTGRHVTADAGTGIVHTAPGHGADDFAACRVFNDAAAPSGRRLPVLCPLDDNGRFSTAAGPTLAGLPVLKQGNAACLAMLRASGALLTEAAYTHRYPYDWRTKQPIVMRATQQWFVDLGELSDVCVDSLAAVDMLPPTSRSRLSAALGGRSQWCISRQRAWGVPIPAFFRRDTGEALLTVATVEHLAALVAAKGSDVWWTASVSELLPPDVAAAAETEGVVWERGSDTLDVWFDSGSSWAAAWVNNPVARELAATAAAKRKEVPGMGLGRPADMVLEGSDQHRGWFQSSLITGAAVTGAAPYASVLSHGFVVAEDLKKMSKSLGNVIAPSDIIDGKPPSKGGKGGATVGRGVDVLRYWVASADYTRDVAVGAGGIERIAETLRKVRNTLRFLLGSLHGYDPSRADAALRAAQSTGPGPDAALPLRAAWSLGVSPALDGTAVQSLRLLDRGMLHKVAGFETAVRGSLDGAEFENAVYAINGFASRDLSPIYVELIKDRLYQQSWGWQQLRRGEGANQPDRFLAQSILWETLRVTTRALAPIAPSTAEDVYQHSAALLMSDERMTEIAAAQGLPLGDALYESGSTVFDSQWTALPTAWRDDGAGWAWDGLLALRAEVNRCLEVARAARDIGSPTDAAVELGVERGSRIAALVYLAVASGQLEDLLGASHVTVVDLSEEMIGVARPPSARQVEVVTAPTASASEQVRPGRQESTTVGAAGGARPAFLIDCVQCLVLGDDKAGSVAGRSDVLSAMAAERGGESLRMRVTQAPGGRCVRCRKLRVEVARHVDGLCSRCDAATREWM
jgi:isoleucyl-tRNA synthetase